MSDIPRYDAESSGYWDLGEWLRTWEMVLSKSGEWVRWEDVEELIKKNERTKDPGQSGTGQSELGKG